MMTVIRKWVYDVIEEAIHPPGGNPSYDGMFKHEAVEEHNAAIDELMRVIRQTHYWIMCRQYPLALAELDACIKGEPSPVADIKGERSDA